MKNSMPIPPPVEPTETEESEAPAAPQGTKKSMPANKPKKAKRGITSMDDLKAEIKAKNFPPKKLGGGYRG